ncbi:unnamed protein product [Thelazia callipaeda]|uniref:MSP domain-containing protein n=1 Tax=Thelazia callipaeda TaxID=103827 RepID=A0A0N5D3R8_THECL|nr:unnamed protein product [Thelazia callipaeda]
MSYLQCTPATIQVPATGGITTHILEAVGTERLAFKVSPPLGFVKPGIKKELQLQRMPGKPGKTKLVVEYIASPSGYDPRKPFVQGADIGTLVIRVRAYTDKKIPDKAPLVAGKIVTKAGQNFAPSPDVNDAKLEAEIEALFKDKEKAAQLLKVLSKEKTTKDDSGSSSGEDEAIQIIMPNMLKNLNLDVMQKNNDELKKLLEMVVSENKRLEDVIAQMMKEITFLREALLSTVMKLASASSETKSTDAAKTTPTGSPASKSPVDSSTGTDAAVQEYISTMMAEGGPTGGIKTASPVPSGSGTTDVGSRGTLQEFSLYCPAGRAGIQSGYAIGVPGTNVKRTKEFIFGSTADQLSPKQGGSSGSTGSGSGLPKKSVYL